MSEPRKVNELDRLSISFYPADDSLGGQVAHCLDLDLVAVGQDRVDALRQLGELIAVQCQVSQEKGWEMTEFPAPCEFWPDAVKETAIPEEEHDAG